MERNNTLVWYKSKECPKYEKWYDGGFGSELPFRARAKGMEVIKRTYRWSELESKPCVLYDSGEDVAVEHVVFVCRRYELLRGRMMSAVRLEVRAWVGDVDEWTPGEWMRVLLFLSNDSDDGRKSLPSALIPSEFLTVLMFPSVVSPSVKRESVSDRPSVHSTLTVVIVLCLPSVLTDCPPLHDDSGDGRKSLPVVLSPSVFQSFQQYSVHQRNGSPSVTE